jgi:predicted CopG family antitoxin
MAIAILPHRYMTIEGHALTKYATISVPRDVKKVLEEAKGRREWGEFLLDLHAEGRRLRSKRAFDELAKALTKEDLESIRNSTREFRERFSFR